MSTPSWLSDRDSDAPPADLHAAPEAHGWAQNNNSMGSGNNNSNGKSNSDTKGNSLVKSIFAFICTGICVFVSATGALAVQFSTSQGRVSALTPDGATLCSPTDATMCSTQAQDIANSFVGVYMVLFALILFVFECAQLCKISCLDHIWKRNFGFLYGINGKAVYLIFMAILVFGLTQPKQLATACGIVTASWGVIIVIYTMKFPHHFDKIEKFNPATDI